MRHKITWFKTKIHLDISLYFLQSKNKHLTPNIGYLIPLRTELRWDLSGDVRAYKKMQESI